MSRARKPKYVIPESIELMGVEFVVEEAPSMKDYGEMDGPNETIRINLGRHRSQEHVDSTFLHECIHGILYVSGQSEKLKGKQEEGLVLALEYGLRPLVTLNK